MIWQLAWIFLFTAEAFTGGSGLATLYFGITVTPVVMPTGVIFLGIALGMYCLRRRVF